MKKEELFNYGIGLLAFSLSFDPDWAAKGLIFCAFLLLIDIRGFSFKLPNKFFLVSFCIGVIYIVVNQLIFGNITNARLLKFIGLTVLMYIFWNNYLHVFQSHKALLFFAIGVYVCGFINFFLGIEEMYGSSLPLFNSWESIRVIDIQKIYYGMYLNMAFVIGFFYFPKEVSKNKYAVFFFLYAATLILLYVVGSLTAILLFILFNCILLLNALKSKFTYKISVIALIMAPILMLMALNIPRLQILFASIDGENSRIRNYNINREIIIQEPILGHGIGLERETMQKFRNERSWEYKNNYHAHNEYFELLIGGGLLLLIFVYGLFVYVLFRNLYEPTTGILGVFFVLVVLFTSLIESLLLRFHGMIFTAFFLSYFILIGEKKTILSSIKKS